MHDDAMRVHLNSHAGLVESLREIGVLTLVKSEAVVPFHSTSHLGFHDAKTAGDVHVWIGLVVSEQGMAAWAAVCCPVPIARAVRVEQTNALHVVIFAEMKKAL